MPTNYLDDQDGVGRHINEVYKDDVYRVTHSEEEFQRARERGWTADKEPGKVYRPVSDTPEAHQRAWHQADARLTLEMDKLRTIIEDPNQEDKLRRESRVKMQALQKRRDEVDGAKDRVFAEKPENDSEHKRLSNQADALRKENERLATAKTDKSPRLVG